MSPLIGVDPETCRHGRRFDLNSNDAPQANKAAASCLAMRLCARIMFIGQRSRTQVVRNPDPGGVQCGSFAPPAGRPQGSGGNGARVRWASPCLQAWYPQPSGGVACAPQRDWSGVPEEMEEPNAGIGPTLRRPASNPRKHPVATSRGYQLALARVRGTSLPGCLGLIRAPCRPRTPARRASAGGRRCARGPPASAWHPGCGAPHRRLDGDVPGHPRARCC